MNRRYHLRRVDNGRTLAMASDVFAPLKTASNMGCEWVIVDMRTGAVQP